jgi:hypothetical protein
VSDRRAGLAARQAWLQAVVTDPRGARAGVAGERARRHLAVDPAAVETMVTASSRLSGVERLGIYNRAYRLRLLECFRVEYPCLRRALGDELFTRFVAAYLEEHPPSGYTLGRLGAHLAAYLEASRPDAGAPDGDRKPWADFLVDLATLERVYLEVYDGEGGEGAALLTPADLLGLPAASFRALRPAPVRGLRVLRLRSAVHEYFAAVRGDADDPQMPPRRELHLAVYRRDYRVQLLSLEAAEAGFLTALGEGETVAGALAAAAPALAEPEARHAVLRWADEGLLGSSAAG